MKITVERDQYEEIAAGRLNSVIATEEWSSMKGMLILECGEDKVVADVIECVHEGQGRWLIIFQPVGVAAHYNTETPISEAVEEVVPPKNPKNRKKLMKFLKSMTKPFNGYYV